MRLSNNLENKTLSDTYWRVQLVYMKVQPHFRTTTGIQSGPDVFDESRFVMTFLTILAVIEILCSFRLVLEGKTGKEITKFIKIRVLRKVFSKIFCFIIGRTRAILSLYSTPSLWICFSGNVANKNTTWERSQDKLDTNKYTWLYIFFASFKIILKGEMILCLFVCLWLLVHFLHISFFKQVY